MKVCKKLFLLAAVLAVASLPLASDAQQPACYWSRNSAYMTVTKQQTITAYYTYMQAVQQQNLSIVQQQQTALMQKNTATTQNRTSLQQNSTQTVQQRTALQLQQEQLLQSRTNLAVNRTQTVCNKTTPQILHTGTQQSRTSLAQQHTATTQQCTYLKTDHTALTQARTSVAQKHTSTVQNKTATVQDHTQLTQQHTTLQQKTTATPLLQNATHYELMTGRKSITTTSTMTMKISTESNCMQCHRDNVPTGTHVAQQSPRMPLQQPPGRFPLMGQQPQSNPLAVQRMPVMPTSVARMETMPALLARQPLMPAAVIPLTPVLAMATPRSMDMPVLVGKDIVPAQRAKLDPLQAMGSANPKQPIALDRLPVALEDAPLRSATKTFDMFDQMTAAQPERRTLSDEIQFFALPLSEEDLQQPPARQLSAAVLQLPPTPVVVDVLNGDQDQEWLLPVLPSSEPLSKRDPLELFGATSQQPVPVNRTPAVQRPVAQPGLPGNRDTEFGPG